MPDMPSSVFARRSVWKRCVSRSEPLAQPPRYDGFCLTYAPDEVARREAAGEPHVVRMQVPGDGVCVVDDLRRGKIEIEWKTVDMQVLMKSDGLPTYHLANVVDDHLMEITHVIRGEEWVSSAPKHILLVSVLRMGAAEADASAAVAQSRQIQAFKRKNPTGILFYQAMGYLPEALMNFLGAACELRRTRAQDEMMSLAQMVSRFRVRACAARRPGLRCRKSSIG